MLNKASINRNIQGSSFTKKMQTVRVHRSFRGPNMVMLLNNINLSSKRNHNKEPHSENIALGKTQYDCERHMIVFMNQEQLRNTGVTSLIYSV